MSEPIGVNPALVMGAMLWKSVTLTRVSVPATGATLLPTTALANRSGLWLWVPSGGGQLYYSFASDATFDTNTPIAYGGVATPIPVTDQVSIYGRSTTGTLTVSVIEYVV